MFSNKVSIVDLESGRILGTVAQCTDDENSFFRAFAVNQQVIAIARDDQLTIVDRQTGQIKHDLTKHIIAPSMVKKKEVWKPLLKKCILHGDHAILHFTFFLRNMKRNTALGKEDGIIMVNIITGVAKMLSHPFMHDKYKCIDQLFTQDNVLILRSPKCVTRWDLSSFPERPMTVHPYATSSESDSVTQHVAVYGRNVVISSNSASFPLIFSPLS
jgi:hypothetical protein